MSDNSLIKDRLIGKINDLKSTLNARKIKYLHLKRLENIVIKLEQYSGECSECDKYLKDLDNDMLDSSSINDIKKMRKYMKDFNKIVAHLCKQHQHTTEGSYRNTYMLLGMSFGMSFGMILGMIIDNTGVYQTMGMSLGMCLGMSFGLLIGGIMDKDAIKKGKVI